MQEWPFDGNVLHFLRFFFVSSSPFLRPFQAAGGVGSKILLKVDSKASSHKPKQNTSKSNCWILLLTKRNTFKSRKMTVQSLRTKTTATADSKNSIDGTSLVPCNTNKRRYYEQNTKQNMRRSLHSWLLLLFLITAIGWVCGFTIYSSHTNFTRKHVYPFFDSTYFQNKEGARIFTYLGIFYLIPGFVVLSSRSNGIDLPRPIPQLVRHFKIGIPSSWWCSSSTSSNGDGGGYWSVLEILAILLFVSVQVLTFASRVWNRFDEYWIPERVWYEVSKCFGKACAFTLSIIFLPISKNCFWLDVFNYKFERAIKFHRWLGWFFTLIVLVHAGTAITSLVMADQFGNCMVPNEDCEMPGGWGNYKGLEISRIITYGWISFLVLLPLIITSMPWFRRHRFEWFYCIHFMFIPFIVLIHLHYKDMIYYTAPGIAAYVLDKVVWWLSTRRPSKIIALSTPAPGFVRMLIAVDPKYKFEPGSWVQIKVPAISKWQWHPMSIASAPDYDGQSASTISIDIKVLGNWTKDLEKLSQRFINPSSQPSMHTTSCVYVEQYQGSSHRRYQGYLNDHPVVLMFAGGIGVTPMISALRDIILQQKKDGTTGSSISSSKKKYYSHIRRIVFVWCVKKKSVLNLYRDELEKIQSLGHQLSACEVDIHVNVTLSEPEQEEADQDNIETTRRQQLLYPNLIHEEEEDINNHPKDQLQSEPLREYVFGYSHTLVLTMAAGFGVLLGIFAVNVLTYEKTPSWRVESKSMLQLFLSCLFSAILVAIGMSGSFLLPISSFENTLQHGKETDGRVCPVSKKEKRNKRKSRSSKSRKVVVENDNKQYHDDDDIELQMIEQQQPEEVEATTTSLCKSDGNGKNDNDNNNLHIILGKRPNVPKFIKNTQKYCIKNDYKSVGVSVCGPDAMVDSVMDACKNASSSSCCCCCCCGSIASGAAAAGNSSEGESTYTNVQFVVDDEVFDW